MINLFSFWSYLYISFMFLIHKRYIVAVFISILYIMFYSKFDLLLTQLIVMIPNECRIPFCMLFVLLIYVWIHGMIVLSIFLLSFDRNYLVYQYQQIVTQVDTNIFDIIFLIISIYYIIIN